MAHANRSLPMARGSEVGEALTLWGWAENFRLQQKVGYVERTKVGFASGELVIDEGSVSLRAKNAVNNSDTIHRVSVPKVTESPSGLVLPLVLVQRIGLPENAANVSMAELDSAEIVPLSVDSAYNPKLAGSVLRAAFLLCELVSPDLAQKFFNGI